MNNPITLSLNDQRLLKEMHISIDCDESPDSRIQDLERSNAALMRNLAIACWAFVITLGVAGLEAVGKFGGCVK